MLARKALNVSMILAVLILIISASFVTGFLLGKTHIDKQVVAENQTEKENLQKELEKFYPPVPEKLTSLNGQIVELGENSFKIKTTIRLRRLPEADQVTSEEKIKTVIIDEKTRIFKIDLKGKIVAGQGAPLKNLKFSDLKVGQQVACSSIEDVDLKTVDSFIAKSVELVF